jgi:hypothetical protein
MATTVEPASESPFKRAALALEAFLEYRWPLPAGTDLDVLFDELERSENADLAHFAAWRREFDADELRSVAPYLERSGRALLETIVCDDHVLVIGNLSNTTAGFTLLATLLALRFAPPVVVRIARHCARTQKDDCTLALLALEYDDRAVIDAMFDASGTPVWGHATAFLDQFSSVLELCTIAQEAVRRRRTPLYDAVVERCLRWLPHMARAFERKTDTTGLEELERRLRISLHAMRPDRVSAAYTESDVDIVVIQAHVSIEAARRVLDETDGNVENAIRYCCAANKSVVSFADYSMGGQ